MVLSRMPTRLAVGLHTGLAMVTAIYVAMSLRTDGPAAIGAWLVTGAVAALWAAATWVTLPPRGRVAADVDRVAGSRPLAALLAAAVGLVLAGTAVWGGLFLADPEAGGDLANPGFVLVMVVGAVGALPTVARAVTGRLHVWELSTGPDGLRYRGGRTDRVLPWIAVGSVVLNDPGTRLEVTPAAAGGPPLSVPTLAFDVPPDQLRDLVVAARARHA